MIIDISRNKSILWMIEEPNSAARLKKVIICFKTINAQYNVRARPFRMFILYRLNVYLISLESNSWPQSIKNVTSTMKHRFWPTYRELIWTRFFHLIFWLFSFDLYGSHDVNTPLIYIKIFIPFRQVFSLLTNVPNLNLMAVTDIL